MNANAKTGNEIHTCGRMTAVGVDAWWGTVGNDDDDIWRPCTAATFEGSNGRPWFAAEATWCDEGLGSKDAVLHARTHTHTQLDTRGRPTYSLTTWFWPSSKKGIKRSILVFCITKPLCVLAPRGIWGKNWIGGLCWIVSELHSWAIVAPVKETAQSTILTHTTCAPEETQTVGDSAAVRRVQGRYCSLEIMLPTFTYLLIPILGRLAGGQTFPSWMELPPSPLTLPTTQPCD